jgi:hypothetical protein
MTVRDALSVGVLGVDLSWDVEHGFISVSGGTGPSTFKTEQHQLVGREVNVRVTLQTYDYLSSTMNRIADEGRFVGPKRALFCEGAVSRLCERLRESKREATAPKGNGTGRELVLADVYGTEADLNNDFLNNFPIGTTAAKRREVTERGARHQVEHDRLVAEGVPTTEAWYRAYGYGEKLVGLAKRWSRRTGGRGRSQDWTQSDENRHRRVNSTAYLAGREAGSEIGLDGQLDATTRRRIGHD